MSLSSPSLAPLSPPASFPFPFPAYDIQESLMRALYRTLESGGLAVLESPTGTGKSLSIICGALTWLRDREQRRKEELEKAVEERGQDDKDDQDEEDWISAAVAKKEREEERRAAKEELQFLLDKEARMEELRRRRKSVRREAVRRTDEQFEELFGDVQDIMEAVWRETAADSSLDREDEELLVEDYHSDEDEEGGGDGGKRRPWEEEDEEDKPKDYSIRIYYTSRTHSQLSQFVREIQKSPFAESARVVSLASRNNLCINEAVRGLRSNGLINERCLEMQKGKKVKSEEDENTDCGGKRKKRKGTSNKCPFRKHSSVGRLRDQALLQVLDIEDLVQAGKKLQACPYYASREGISDAQVVVLPYNTLLHQPTREAVGISLEGAVVVVDEAHNLLETVSHIHAVQLTGEQICRAHAQLAGYVDRYRSRLKAKNLLYLKQIMFVLLNLARVLGGRLSAKGGGGQAPEQKVEGGGGKGPRLVDTVALMGEAQILNLDLFKLVRYVEKSKIAQKLHGFSDKYGANRAKKEEAKKGVGAFLESLGKKKDVEGDNKGQKEQEEAKKQSSVSAGSSLMVLVEFVQALTSVNIESRVLVSPGATLGEGVFKYCLLSPSSKFADLVRKCRSVVVAGGTMQPPSEFVDQLFVPCGAKRERVELFSCGHVVPGESVLPLVVPCGPSGRQLDFSYERRDLPETKDELYRLLANVCNLVPGGVVVFFPSYEYEGRVHEHFKSRGYLDRLGQKKRIFREPKRALDMETVLKDFSSAARMKNGALLLSVVGGKMSEGINFSDELGRCVVMVGLPFPNARSLELKEKMSHLDSTVGQGAGRLHYENLCMKAVNQSVGRAIRHKGDYAAIILADHRYQRQGILRHLPGWIGERVEAAEKFPKVIVSVRNFFREKAAAATQ